MRPGHCDYSCNLNRDSSQTKSSKEQAKYKEAALYALIVVGAQRCILNPVNTYSYYKIAFSSLLHRILP